MHPRNHINHDFGGAVMTPHMTMRIMLAASLFFNTVLAVQLYAYVTDYNSLLAWACDHGNGGSECGED